MGDDRSDPEDTRAKLLDATGEAIAEHGVANVTTQKIADEWGRSQSLVHYYYETKDDLVVAYIEALHDDITNTFADHMDDRPLERLENAVVGDIDHGEGATTSLVLFDLHGNAPFNERYQDALNDLEDEAREFLETTVEDGIDAGTFRDVSPAEVTTFLLSAHDGGILRTATLGRRADVDPLISAIERYVAECLLTEKARTEWDGFGADETVGE